MRVVLSLCMLMGFSGCLFYDSRWGEDERAQRRFAQEHHGAELAKGRVQQWSALPSLRVVAYVDEAYRRAHSDTQVALEEILERCNPVLASELRAKLSLVEVRAFAPPRGADDLHGVLGHLVDIEDGDQFDIVLGVVGASPLVTPSFDQLGSATVLSRYIVLRDLHDSNEYEVFVQGLDELEEAERLRLFASRRHHKQAAVLLHELGHLLGAIHTRDERTLMHSAYSAQMDHFAPENIMLMRVGLDYLRAPERERSRLQLIERLGDRLSRQAQERWVPSELQEYRAMLATIHAELAKIQQSMSAEPPHRASAAQPPTLPQTISGQPLVASASVESDLSGDAETAFTAARQALTAGEPRRAFNLIKPVADDHPESYAAQHLACEAAMHSHQPLGDVREFCNRITSGAP